MSRAVTVPAMTTFLGFARFVNEIGGGILFTGFLFILLIIIFYVVNTERMNDKIMTSTFIVAILATLLRAGSLIGDQFLMLFWVLAGISVFYAIYSRD